MSSPGHLSKERAGVSRLKDTHIRAARITAAPLRSQSRQESVSAIEWLSTSIVHDLRNPLGSIYAAAEMLIEGDSGPTQVRRLATNIFQAAIRMRELLADLSSVGVETNRRMRSAISARSLLRHPMQHRQPGRTITFRFSLKSPSG
jgi:signal transduction histidine kinase